MATPLPRSIRGEARGLLPDRPPTQPPPSTQVVFGQRADIWRFLASHPPHPLVSRSDPGGGQFQLGGRCPEQQRQVAEVTGGQLAKVPAHLDTPGLLTLAWKVRALMRPGAVWAVELQDLASVANRHQDLDIRVRRATVGDRTAVLEFPDANVLVVPGQPGEPPVLWQSYTLTVETSAGREQTRYGHQELLYDPDYLLRLPAIAANFTRVWTLELDAAFPQSTLLALRALP